MNVFILTILLTTGCTMQDSQTIKLPSTIFAFNMQQPSYVYINNKKSEFYLTRKTAKHQSVFGWLNKVDLLLLSESSKDNFGSVFYDNLCTTDIKNQIRDTLYKANIGKGEIISGAYITPDDSLILVHINYKPLIKDAQGWFYSPLDIVIIDYKKKKEVDRIENFYSYNIHFRQSSAGIFSPEGTKFTYAISDERNWYTDDKKEYNLNYKKENGIYIYDLESRVHQKIIDGGVDPIWSPDGNTIAYSENNKVWFYDLKSKEKTLFYQTKDRHTVVKIIWTPDGDNIYILTREKTKLNPRGILTHRLINIKDKSETINGELMKLGLSFFWK